MEIEFDPKKNQFNIETRGIDFNLALEFDLETALIREDTRRDYKEQRFIAIGYIKDRLYVLVFTPREAAMRVISLRKANKRECQLYAKYQS